MALRGVMQIMKIILGFQVNIYMDKYVVCLYIQFFGGPTLQLEQCFFFLLLISRENSLIISKKKFSSLDFNWATVDFDQAILTLESLS